VKYTITLMAALIGLLALSGGAMALQDCWKGDGIAGTTGSAAYGMDFAYVGGDTPAVAYYDSAAKSLYYASLNGKNWAAMRVDSGGMFPSLAVLNNGLTPAMSYYNSSKGDIEYAWFDSMRGRWVNESVDTKGNVGSASSLAILSSGAPAIAYYDSTNGDLKYAYKSGKKWKITTIDKAGNVGLNPSLSLLQDGSPVITYSDAAGALKYAKLSGKTWSTSVIDASADPLVHSSLDVLSNGTVAVAYAGKSTGALKYASLNGGTWQATTIDASVDAGRDISLTALLAGKAAIAYRDMTTGLVKYAKFNGTTWQTSTLDNTVQDGFSGVNRLAVGTNGGPAIVYADWANNCARYDVIGGGLPAGPASEKILANVPDYLWNNGCAPTAGGMVIGFWDRTAYPGLVTGTMPMFERPGGSARVDSVISSKEHIADPYYQTFAYNRPPGGWVLSQPQPNHANNCIADYMVTDTPGGGSWDMDIAQGMLDYAGNHPNGLQGLNFNVDVYYSPTFDHLKYEIDAGRPVMIFIPGHAMVAYGYFIDPATGEEFFAARDTWGDGLTTGVDGAFLTSETVGGQNVTVEWWPWLSGSPLSDDTLPWEIDALVSFTPTTSAGVLTYYPGPYGAISGYRRASELGGRTLPLSGTMVPEPLSMILALCGLGALCIGRKRMRQAR